MRKSKRRIAAYLQRQHRSKTKKEKNAKASGNGAGITQTAIDADRSTSVVRWLVHAAGHNDGRGGYAVTQTTTFKRAARIERGKKRRCDVRSNAHDAREIRRRQAGATLKRATVKQNGVRAQTVRVCCASSCNRNKAKC